ncbi:MAG: heme-binding protein [Cyanobacteria bacterium REEB446]|nr:heme-binding protein [Cyanobacteria bacterium REEB446]
MNKPWIIITSITLTLLLGYAALGPAMSNVEKPQYQLISEQGNIQIREYNPSIVAEVQVQGEREEAISQGFRLLADYIFGNNKVEQDIAMTAPVTQQSGQKIAMTAPVKQQGSDNAWKVNFTMPSKYSMNTLPKPNNEKVTLYQVPSKKYIVIKFSGMGSNKNLALHEKELQEYISKNKIQTLSEPIYAFYNPPWTLAFLRHNEIMIEIK